MFLPKGKLDMKILYVTTVGLTMVFFKDIIRELISEGHTVDIATNENEFKVDEIYREMGCNIYQIGFSRSPASLANIKAYREIKKLISDNHYDIIHCHTPVAGVITRLVCRRLRKTGLKVFYTAHGFHFFKGAPFNNWLIYYPIEKLLSRFTDVLITINREDYHRAEKKFHAGKTYYIHGVGFDTHKFSDCRADRDEKRKELGVENKDFMLLSVGELHNRKNHRVVIEALHILRDPDIAYFIVGSGSKRSEYEKLIGEYGLQDRVKLLGYRNDIAELCKTADCFVHPSVREGLGIAPLEAMASGLPLIAADINGIKDYAADGITGCCVDPRDVGQMCSAIRKMKNDAAFRNACAENNRRIAGQFDREISIGEMKDIYHSAMSERV